MSQHYEKASQKLSFKQILWNNFLAGIAWALGATIGISIIFALLGLLSKNPQPPLFCRLRGDRGLPHVRAPRPGP